MDSASTPPSASDHRNELARLAAKLDETSDPDIVLAIRSRIVELEGLLKQEAEAMIAEPPRPPETAPKLSREESDRLRKELAGVSASLYSEDDPAKRKALQDRVVALQGLLGIDVQKLAGQHMSQNAVPDVPVPTKPKKEPAKKARVELAELQALVAEKSAQIRKTEIATELNLPENPEPPTPQALAEAERLIQQARVEKMRGNQQEVRMLLERAVQTAPGSPAVLEMVGDDYAERKQSGRALAYYRQAAKLSPKDVNLERKVAMAALGVNAVNAQASSGGLDDSAIPMASRKAAILISLFMPGLGHLVIGQKVKGAIILGVWCIMLAWVILMGTDVANISASLMGGKKEGNYIVIVPILTMLVTYISTLASIKGSEEPMARSAPAERPRPPMDLPFE